MRGVAGDQQPAVLHRLADEAAQPRAIALDDAPAIEPRAAAVVHAPVELVPHLVVAHRIDVERGIDLQIEAADRL